MNVERFAYGSDPSQHADLYLPAGTRRPGTVVLVHGGFWRARFGLEVIEDVARDLTGRGWVVWNVEYRRVGNGGGWPETLLDVAAAVDHLAVVSVEVPLDLTRVVAVGHSAGGHLAAWAAGRHTAGRDPSGKLGWGEDLDGAVPGRDPVVEITGVISLAGVLDLATAAAEGIGNDAARSFMGGDRTRRPARYAATDPLAQVPIEAPVVAVHARGDFNVPFEQSVAYVERARAAGQEATLVEVEGDHFTVVDVASQAWPEVIEALAGLTG